MKTATVADLKKFEQLQNVPDEQLQWLIDMCEERRLQDGELLSQQGDPIAGPFFIMSGRLALYAYQNNRKRAIADFTTGDITGYLPYSRAVNVPASSRSMGESVVLVFPVDKINMMVREQFELTQALVHVMTNRVRNFTALEQQNEKMMALGKLSAGMAHELNNPASAIVRDSAALREHFRIRPESFKNIISIKMDAAHIDAVTNELFSVLNDKNRPHLTLKEKSRREDELTTWLDDHGLEDAYDMAANFAEYDFTIENFDNISKIVPDDYLAPIFNWMCNVLESERLVEDIQESARRIADLVTSVKTYTHMDRGTDKQFADIHIGIRNTITMLGYRFKKGNIALVEEYDQRLPPVKALIGELNQVWTNLIDNALDAMEANGKGTLTIKTLRDGEFVCVSVIDDGPGIPEEIRANIFDSFFTTKALGKGTGLGLEVVQRITLQHNGTVKVNSEPGRTEFIVCFPING
jgi:signal transduction histidine kinase